MSFQNKKIVQLSELENDPFLELQFYNGLIIAVRTQRISTSIASHCPVHQTQMSLPMWPYVSVTLTSIRD